MLLRTRWYARHWLVPFAAILLYLRRTVGQRGRRQGRRDKPFTERNVDGSLKTTRGEYQEYVAGQLTKWVMSVKRTVARPLTKAVDRCESAQLAVPNCRAERDRCEQTAKNAKPPLLGRAKYWLTVGLMGLLGLDMSVAYGPVERLGMSGPMTLLFSLAIVILLNGLAAAVGWVSYRLWVEPDRSLPYAAERMLKFFVAAALLAIGVIIYSFAQLRAETGHPIIWGAVSVASVLLSALIGVMHHGDAPWRNLKKAERELIKAERKLIKATAALMWKMQVAEALGLHQRAVAVGLLAGGDEKCRRAYEWNNRGQTAPAIPDPQLLTNAEISRLVLAPVNDRGIPAPLSRLALQPARP